MMALDPHLQPYLGMLKESFPRGVTRAERAALLSLLFSQFSERNLADLLAEFLDDERVVVIADAIKAVSKSDRDLVTIRRVRTVLADHGWDFDDGDG
jgi:hypothetical protein